MPYVWLMVALTTSVIQAVDVRILQQGNGLLIHDPNSSFLTKNNIARTLTAVLLSFEFPVRSQLNEDDSCPWIVEQVNEYCLMLIPNNHNFKELDLTILVDALAEAKDQFHIGSHLAFYPKYLGENQTSSSPRILSVTDEISTLSVILISIITSFVVDAVVILMIVPCVARTSPKAVEFYKGQLVPKTQPKITTASNAAAEEEEEETSSTPKKRKSKNTRRISPDRNDTASGLMTEPSSILKNSSLRLRTEEPTDAYDDYNKSQYSNRINISSVTNNPLVQQGSRKHGRNYSFGN